MDSYTKTADAVVVALRDWAADRVLPTSAWELPKDCPLWSMGLSLFQASWALAVHRLCGDFDAAAAEVERDYHADDSRYRDGWGDAMALVAEALRALLPAPTDEGRAEG